MSDEGYDAEATVIHVSPRALLVEIDGEQFWVPHSQIHDESELSQDSSPGDSGTLVMSTWIAEQKGLL